MSASLGGVTIYLEQDTGWISAPRFALHDVLDSTETIIHLLSVPSSRRMITGTVKNDYPTLKALGDAAAEVTFSTDDGTSGQCYILSISGQRIQNVGTDVWYRFTAELIEAS